MDIRNSQKCDSLLIVLVLQVDFKVICGSGGFGLITNHVHITLLIMFNDFRHI